ncbi:hypothetical protein F4679DRAFT_72658 [Xylaria curta]|nr:hypothetical protein F4679DRAFT_72658 [Xylaria curta]
MPRASASAKRQSGASNNRDTKHESGLVGPGKRIPRQTQQQQQKVQGQPNASAPCRHSTPQQQAQFVAEDALIPSAPSTPPVTANGFSDEMHPDPRSPESLRRSSLGAYSETSSAESYNSHALNVASEENHRRIDVNATKNSNVHRDPGPLDFAYTVLRLCPLQDTIAILIILMQIPPLALSGIYVLFTLLTFVTSNGLTFSDVFEWNLGAPSLATVICVDGIVLLIWLFLWGPVQRVILDLAQMVIALGLGGGSSSRDGGSMKNTLICLSMILLSHILRHTKMRYSPIGYLLGSSRFMTPDLDDPLESLDLLRGYDKVQSGWFAWVKSILAIHILTQGLVKYIRDWYLRRERRDSLAQNAADPEAGKSYTPDADGGFSTPDTDATALQNSNALTTKKKRKQSAQVRNRQPLWAALASTKIVVVKEYELTHATAESAGSNATDIHNLGNAPFNTQPGQIWISYVGCDEVCFNTSQFPTRQSNETHRDDSGDEFAKPFYVRVNNAIWQPTRMRPVESCEEGSGPGIRWSGDIYGLTPMSNYECEFVCSITHGVLFSTSVRTTQPKSTDADAAGSKTPAQRSLRPDSPITTLKTSIAANESKLAEERARQKALRKEFHRKVNAIKKENEKLSAAVQSAGTGDDKLRQKVQQNATQQKQAEQAMTNLELELKECEKIPESLKSSWKSKQSAWTNEKAKFDGAVATFKNFKASVEGGIKGLEDERASLQAKRNKISNRIAKVDGEHARITDANARGLDEAERRRQAREAFEKDISRTEREFVSRINDHETIIFNREQENMMLKAQLDSFHTQVAYPFTGSYENFGEAASQFAQAGPSAHAQSNITSTVPYDAPAAWNNSLYQNSLWGPSPLASAFIPHATVTSPPHHQATKSRGRSSSMLSNVSGFTQSSGDDDEWGTVAQGTTQSHWSLGPPPGLGFQRNAKHAINGEAISDGSHSPSGGSSGSGSARDPTSPPPS